MCLAISQFMAYGESGIVSIWMVTNKILKQNLNFSNLLLESKDQTSISYSNFSKSEKMSLGGGRNCLGRLCSQANTHKRVFAEFPLLL